MVRLLILLLAISPLPAIDFVSAARELAAKIAARTGPAQISLDVRAPKEDDAAAVRGRLIPELRTLRVRTGDSKTTVRVTLSESLRMTVWTAEILSENARDIVMIERLKDNAEAQPGPRFSLERTLLLEQALPILDVAFVVGGIAVLEPAAVMIYEAGKPSRRLPFDLPHEPSRDLRGRLTVTETGMRAFLPGLTCDAGPDGATCRRAQDPWPLDGIAATLASGRNYFTRGKDQFYSSASVDDQGERTTVLAGTDGRTQIQGLSAGDISGIGCAGRRYLLAISAADEGVLDSYRVVNRLAAPAADRIEFFGPLTALWPSGDDAVAVARHRTTGRYAAYRLALVCTP
jgi:hypothetical protein